MQSFTVTQIQTTPEEVILSGKRGMIRIRRVSDAYSGAAYHTSLFGFPEKDPKIHTMEIRDIPKPKGLFTNIAF